MVKEWSELRAMRQERPSPQGFVDHPQIQELIDGVYLERKRVREFMRRHEGYTMRHIDSLLAVWDAHAALMVAKAAEVAEKKAEKKELTAFAERAKALADETREKGQEGKVASVERWEKALREHESTELT